MVPHMPCAMRAFEVAGIRYFDLDDGVLGDVSQAAFPARCFIASRAE